MSSSSSSSSSFLPRWKRTQRNVLLAIMVYGIIVAIDTSEIDPPLPSEILESTQRSWQSISSSAKHKRQQPRKDPLQTLQKAVQDTTRLIYEKSPHLDFWLQQDELPRIYVYDTIPTDWSDARVVSDCVDRHFLDLKAKTNETNDDDNDMQHGKNCRWYPDICQDTTTTNVVVGPKAKMFQVYRANYVTDVALLEWFRSYPHQTKDPNEADLFVVSYPHWSKCLCAKDFRSANTLCSHKLSHIQTNVVQHLVHLNATNANRHLWLLGVDWGLVGPKLAKSTIQASLSLGPAQRCLFVGNTSRPCGHLVNPYLNTAPEYQPNILFHQPWWYQPEKGQEQEERPYAMATVMGFRRGLDMRRQFLTTHKALLGNDIGGKPYYVGSLDGATPQLLHKGGNASSTTTDSYRKSLFCPILPGDGPPQKRFFDAILNGCIPVLPMWWSLDRHNEYQSAWKEYGASIQKTYPYHIGTYFGDDTVGIDYRNDLFVTFNGTCGLACLKGAMEQAMANQTNLHRLQTNLRKYAQLFTYGLEENRYQSVDAFTALLVGLRHYVIAISDKLPAFAD